MPAKILAVSQGVYYLITGLWSLVAIDLFQEVTGSKQDLWLVKTVGALLMMIGVILMLAAFRDRIRLEAALLGAGTALVIGLVDVIYVIQDAIAPIYLADAAAEAVILVAWLVMGLRKEFV